MKSAEIWARFVALKKLVENEPNASDDRADEFGKEWEFLYDAACDESDHDGSELTDAQYDEICKYDAFWID